MKYLKGLTNLMLMCVFSFCMKFIYCPYYFVAEMRTIAPIGSTIIP